MLYPFTITFDLHIQADSYEEAEKIASQIAKEACIDSQHSDICTDLMEVVDYGVLDINE